MSKTEGELETYRGVVAGVDCDLMGHMNTARYAAVFDAATWAMLRALGYRWVAGEVSGWADVKNTFDYLHELPVDTQYYVSSSLSRLGNSSFTLIHQLYQAESAQVAARCEAILVNFDRKARKSMPLSEDFRNRASKLLKTRS